MPRINKENTDPKTVYAIYRIPLDKKEGCIKELVQQGYKTTAIKDAYDDFDLLINQNPPTKQLPWASVLSSMAEKPDEILRLRNKYASFALFYETKNSVYVTTGGLASSIVKHHSDSDFGLSIASRLLKRNKILSIRAKPLAGQESQEETTYRRRHDVSLDPKFRGRIAREIIGEVDKEEVASQLGLDIADKDTMRLRVTSSSLNLLRAMTIAELKQLVTACDDLLQQPETEELAIFKGFKEVRGKEAIDKLKERLSTDIDEQYQTYLADRDGFVETNIGLSYDDPRRTLLCSQILYHIGNKEPVQTEKLSLWHLFEALSIRSRGQFNKADLAGIHISGIDEDERNVLPKETLYSFLYAELKEASNAAALVDSKWYEMTPAFKDEVNQQVEDLLRKVSDHFAEGLPNWNVQDGKAETEPEYISRVCDKINLVQLHGDHVIIAGPDKSEICDILDRRTADGRLIFVKKGFGSYLREGLGQMRTSVQLLARDPAFRNDAIQKIKAIPGVVFMSTEFTDCGLIIAVTDHSMLRQDVDLIKRLTTLVKLDLIDTDRLIREYGYSKVALFEVKQAQDSGSTGSGRHTKT